MAGQAWALEVVRGREVGRIILVPSGPQILGHGLNGESGIDLAEVEPPSPRKMAARQAVLERTRSGLTLRDLDSPGGTFVNRQRLLSGQARTLTLGDVLQLGGVQLKVVEPSAPPPQPAVSVAPARQPTVAQATRSTVRTGPLSTPFVFANGTTCRSWDDFLNTSSHDWQALRDELVSGRLTAFLQSQGRSDLLPRPVGAGQSDDERLDDWLGRIPTTRPASAEMEVHPSLVRLTSIAGGGVSRASIRITNTGYRLLKNAVRIEPDAAGWISVGRPFASGTFTTTEETEIPLDVTIPERLESGLTGRLWIEGNAGRHAVEVRLEPVQTLEAIPEAMAGSGAGLVTPLLDRFLDVSPSRRLQWMTFGGLGLRLLVASGSLVASGPPGRDGEVPSLLGPALIFGVLGTLIAGRLASKHGEPRDLPFSLVSGGFTGVLSATLAVAACRAVEPLLGRLGTSTLVACGLWAGLGALGAFLVNRAVSVRSDKAQAAGGSA